ncbi:MAG: amino acid racemase [Nanoarchaeota archaeon]
MTFSRIGVLGGMGPEASSDFYSRMISYCQKRYGAVQDADYPPILLYSLPMAGFDESGIVDAEEVLSQLIGGVKLLSDAGCDFIVIPCNTVHTFIADLRASSSIPIISIIEETVNRVQSAGFKEVCLVASESTLSYGMYQEALWAKDIYCAVPQVSQYPLITDLIRGVMGGSVDSRVKSAVLDVICQMVGSSTKAVILGCTEIPLAIGQEDIPVAVFDTLQVLAETAVDLSVCCPYPDPCPVRHMLYKCLNCGASPGCS